MGVIDAHPKSVTEAKQAKGKLTLFLKIIERRSLNPLVKMKT
jgi:hypothetical protein